MSFSSRKQASLRRLLYFPSLLALGEVIALSGCGSSHNSSSIDSSPAPVPIDIPSPNVTTSPSPGVSGLPSPSPGPQSVPLGEWGGPHAFANVEPNGTDFQFECARGATDQPLILDDSGSFQVSGVYSSTSGPIHSDPNSGQTQGFAALYSGRIENNEMTLNVQYQDESGNDHSQIDHLTYGGTPVFDRLCSLVPSPPPSEVPSPSPSLSGTGLPDK